MHCVKLFIRSRMSSLSLRTRRISTFPVIFVGIPRSEYLRVGSECFLFTKSNVYHKCTDSCCSSFAKGESTLHLLSHIYAQRASELWKIPEITDWVRSSVDSALLTKLASITSPTRVRAQEAYKAGTPENFVRHVIVAENRSVMTFFSPNAVPQTMNAYDPVPPRTSLSQYDEEYFHGVTAKERGAGGRRRQQQMQQQMQGADEEEMAQIQEMIMQEIRERQRLAGDVPGGFPEAAGEPFVAHEHEGEVDSDIDDHDEEDEEDEEEEDVVSAQMTFLIHTKPI